MSNTLTRSKSMAKQEIVIEKKFAASDSNSKVGHAQQGNLRFLEGQIHELWALGENIVLCWAASRAGIDLLVVPHYFLGNFSAALNDDGEHSIADEENGQFIRDLIAGERRMSRANFELAVQQLGLKRTTIKLPIPLSEEAPVLLQIEGIVKRHSISYVPRRAVLLLDIVDFSLFTPFEQTSQLTSLSYSLNSAFSRMRSLYPEIDIVRTTTGDGFYVWNRSEEASASMHLFQFMLLVITDNAIAKRKAKSDTVPALRAGFHIGSHYEFYQSVALNPTMNSYIVGDVTIELARMLDLAQSGQIFVGDFTADIPTSTREGAYLIEVDSQKFLDRVSQNMSVFKGQQCAGEEIVSMHAYLTGETGLSAGQILRKFKVTDKHGCSRYVYNLRCNIHIKENKTIILGLQDYYLPKSSRSKRKSLAADKTATTLYRKARQSPDISEDLD